MNARTVTSLLVLAVLSLGAALAPAEAALAVKLSPVEAQEAREDHRQAPPPARGQARSHPVKQQAAPVQGHRNDRQGDRDRGDDRNRYADDGRGRRDRDEYDAHRPASTYQPGRGNDHVSRPRYDSSRHRYAYTQPRYVPPRAVHHHYPSRRYYYPPRGYVAPVLPRHVVVVHHRHYDYWYGGGVWYRPYGARYVVVAPPLGVFVSVLPSFYSTLWFGGIPYYYANDAYYVWRESRRAYEVVAPPLGAATAAAGPVTEDIFVYPREGQGEEQVAFDRYECHRWASDQTGFDPTQPWGGVSEDQAAALRESYLRAMTACLEGRGYTVR